MIFMGVALFAQPLKDPTRKTFLAPGANTVNLTPPGVVFGGSGVTVLVQLHVPLNAMVMLSRMIT
jgi:hypothetical protein